MPEFTNAAYGVRVEADSTCGAVEREFCSTKPGSKNEGRRIANSGGVRHSFILFGRISVFYLTLLVASRFKVNRCKVITEIRSIFCETERVFN